MRILLIVLICEGMLFTFENKLLFPIAIEN
jgi:hypothetical protein